MKKTVATKKLEKGKSKTGLPGHRASRDECRANSHFHFPLSTFPCRAAVAPAATKPATEPIFYFLFATFAALTPSARVRATP
jgi:hypothetical protein